MTKTQKIVYYVLLVLTSVLFVFTSWGKLSSDPTAIAGFAQAHLPLWFMYFIGACELLGAIGLWIPKLQKWAAYGLLVILAGAVVTTFMFISVRWSILPLAVGIVLWFVAKLGNKKSAAAVS